MSGREKHIDVRKSDYSVIDNEFDNMKERFESEMRRVEDEMSRLRREFESYTPKMHNGQPAPALTGTDHHQYSASSHRSQNQQVATAQKRPKPVYDPYLDNLKSPLIKDESDGKILRLRFNVNQYKPEEVTVKTVDNRLLVHAKHEEKSPQRTIYREYNQEFMLPRGTNPETITSSLSTDGVLTVETPLPAIEGPQQ